MHILTRKRFELCAILGAMITLIAAPASAAATADSCDPGGAGVYHDWARIKVGGNHKRAVSKSGPQMVQKMQAEAALDEMMRPGFDDAGNPWTSKVHLQMVKANSRRLVEFRGSAGLVSYVWIEILEAMLGTNTDFSNSVKADVRAWGRINQNNAAPNSAELGFHYDSGNGSGHVWVTMCFEIRVGDPTIPTNPTVVVRYAVKTEVANCGFREHDRGLGTGSDRIFPGSYLPFTASNSALITFDKKLEAVNFRAGKTNGSCAGHTPPTAGYVTVSKVFWDENRDGTFGVGEERTSSNYPNLFLPSAEACLDMFFNGSYPSQFNNTSPRPEYCLGRCADPPIVNSGA